MRNFVQFLRIGSLRKKYNHKLGGFQFRELQGRPLEYWLKTDTWMRGGTRKVFDIIEEKVIIMII